MFPFGMPFATTAYLVLYVLTLAAHWVFAAYVVIGAVYLALSSIRRTDESADPLATVLRDWLPFFVSTAITLGVAPLLFVQILHQKSFYTANLLLSHRWMAMLPVLIVGFYLLYVVKRRNDGRIFLIDRVARWVAVLAFLFTAYSWTENHLLSTREASWPSFYKDGHYFLADAETFLRLAAFFVGAIPVACMIFVRQLSWSASPHDQDNLARWRQSTARLGLAGLIGATLLSLGYWFMAAGSLEPEAARRLGGRALPYLVLGGGAAMASSVLWFRMVRANHWQSSLWYAQMGATSILLVSVAVVRECIRIARIDFEALYPNHADAAANGGLVTFFVFLVINAGLIVWCVRSVTGGMSSSSEPASG